VRPRARAAARPSWVRVPEPNIAASGSRWW
jgi:hypothetical protein